MNPIHTLQTYVTKILKSSDYKFSTFTPNVVIEWLTILLRIREVPGSNLGPETGYPD